MSILGFLIAVSLVLGGLAWWFFVWTVKSGQYEDPEGAKYRMLEDDEEAATAAPTSTSTSTATATPDATSSPTPTTAASGSPVTDRE